MPVLDSTKKISKENKIVILRFNLDTLGTRGFSPLRPPVSSEAMKNLSGKAAKANHDDGEARSGEREKNPFAAPSSLAFVASAFHAKEK